MMKITAGRRLAAVLLAGAMATGGIIVSQVASATPAEAGACGYRNVEPGNAYARNSCGVAFGEVGRTVGVNGYVFTDSKVNGIVNVYSALGNRWYEEALIY